MHSYDSIINKLIASMSPWIKHLSHDALLPNPLNLVIITKHICLWVGTQSHTWVGMLDY